MTGADSLDFSVSETSRKHSNAASFSVDDADSSGEKNDVETARLRRVIIQELREEVDSLKLDRDLKQKTLDQMKRALEDQHVTLTDQHEKLEQLESRNQRLEIENLNAAEVISQLTGAKQTAESAAQAEPPEADGDDNACRRPGCIKIAAEFEEARTRFQQSANKLSAKLEKAERSSRAEAERAGELDNHVKTLETETKKLKEKLHFEEDQLEAANRRVNEANERAEAIEQ